MLISAASTVCMITLSAFFVLIIIMIIVGHKAVEVENIPTDQEPPKCYYMCRNLQILAEIAENEKKQAGKSCVVCGCTISLKGYCSGCQSRVDEKK